MARTKVGLFFLLISATQAFVDDKGTSNKAVGKDESKVDDIYIMNDTKISTSNEQHDVRTKDDLFKINQRVGLDKKKFPGAKLEGGDYVITNRQRLIEILSRHHAVASDVTSKEARHWPKVNGRVKVPYSIDRDVRRNRDKMRAINQAIKNYKTKSCIDFEPVGTRKIHHIRFINNRGCWSYIGMIKEWKQQPISIGDGCTRIGTVEHEMLHALGFFHEQSRSDRDKYVRIMFQNLIRPRYANNFKKNKAEDEITKGIPYDYNSVMHYGSTYFAKPGTFTMVKRNGDRIYPQRRGLSPLDRKLLNKVYGCSGGGKPSCQERCKRILNHKSYANRVCRVICGRKG